MGRYTGWIIVFVGIVLFIGLILFTLRFIFGIGAPNQVTTETNAQVSENGAVTVNDIVTHPGVYKDLEVNIEGTIVDWVAKNAFILGQTTTGFLGNGLFGPTGGLLVINDERFNLPEKTPEGQLSLGERSRVRIRGTVRIMQPDQVGAELEDTLPEDYNRFVTTNYPTLLADTIQEIQ